MQGNISVRLYLFEINVKNGKYRNHLFQLESIVSFVYKVYEAIPPGIVLLRIPLMTFLWGGGGGGHTKGLELCIQGLDQCTQNLDCTQGLERCT